MTLESHTIPTTRHLNYHDLSLILPWLRWFRVMSRASPGETLAARNHLVAELCSREIER